MPLTPSEIERKLRQHDNDIAEIYAKLVTIEHKADNFRLQVSTRFDRIETRLQSFEVAVTGRLDVSVSHVGELSDRVDEWNDRFGKHLTGISTHLTGINDHLSGMDAILVELIRRLPEPA